MLNNKRKVLYSFLVFIILAVSLCFLLFPAKVEFLRLSFTNNLNNKGAQNMPSFDLISVEGIINSLAFCAFVLFIGIKMFKIHSKENSELEYLIKIFEASRDFTALITPGGKINYINSSGKKILGFSSDRDIIGKSISRIYAKESLNIILREGIPSAIRDGIWKSGTTLIHSCGKDIEVSQSIIVHRSKEGNVEYLSVVIPNILDEEKLQQDIALIAEARTKRQRNAILKISGESDFLEESFIDRIKIISKTMTNVIEAERASVWLLSEDNQKLCCIDLFERSLDKHSSGSELCYSDYPNYFNAIDESRAIDAFDANVDERTREFSDKYLRLLGISSMLDAGVRLQGKVAGVVCIEHIEEKRHWRDDEITFIGEIADQVAQLLMTKKRKESEEKLRKSENMLQSIFRSAPSGIGLVRNREFVWVNEKFCKMLGYSSSEVVGKNSRMIYESDEEYKRVGDVKRTQIKLTGTGVLAH
ncbi:MAG: PAS domain S-box protein [Candidatus Zapsychrus exili]|nr:PAS domain S-box protein [Candidatus Zapsychrus exili]